MRGESLLSIHYRKEREREQEVILAALTGSEHPHQAWGYPVLIETLLDDPRGPRARCEGCREILVHELIPITHRFDLGEAVAKIREARAAHMPTCSGYVDDLPDGVVLGQE